MSCLEDFGWRPELASALAGCGGRELVAGRISEEQKGAYRVLTASTELPAVLGGRLRHAVVGREELPAVGDWVALRVEAGLASIRSVLPRSSALLRLAAGGRTQAQVVAANVDVAFFAVAIDRPFNPALAERALALVRESGSLPVLVLNKADLARDVERDRAAAVAAAPGVPVHLTSGHDGTGLDALAAHLGRGRTGSFFGPSGVGKSTLVNRLVETPLQTTGEVRDWDRRGRHTTSARQLVLLPSGGVLIDTPGMRELGLWDSDTDLGSVFADVEALAARCAFRDCAHAAEPGCAVRGAIARGTLDERRLASLGKLRGELARLDRRIDDRARRDESHRSRRRLRALRLRAERSE